jgi:hypothetical protein
LLGNALAFSIGPALFALLKGGRRSGFIPLDQKRVDDIERELATRAPNPSEPA